ncbi:MAG TPA: hypothetical protein VHW67_07635 [Solirubrobacteraceae bacterium]|jgi:hypothetical protein|nr:hypothetical protein [Solirubrobacteraceae bacterium]
MISSEVQRTLVKSAPELWAEISDPESLARHLGEFGEIRITRLHPEQKVEWEARDGEASGTVLIKPSGWGTKVKLTVTRELPRVEVTTEADREEPQVAEELKAEAEAADECESESGSGELSAAPHEPVAESEPGEPAESSEPAAEPEERSAEQASVVEELQPVPAEEPILAARRQEPDPEEAPAEPTPQALSEPAPEVRRGFFARLFGRRKAPAPGVEAAVPASEPAYDEHEREAALALEAGDDRGLAEDRSLDRASDFETEREIEPTLASELDAIAEQAAEPSSGGSPVEPTEEPRPNTPAEQAEDDSAADLAAGIRTAEEAAAEQVTAVLTGVLDRLGAAHHRPFSRA